MKVTIVSLCPHFPDYPILVTVLIWDLLLFPRLIRTIWHRNNINMYQLPDKLMFIDCSLNKAGLMDTPTGCCIDSIQCWHNQLTLPVQALHGKGKCWHMERIVCIVLLRIVICETVTSAVVPWSWWYSQMYLSSFHESWCVIWRITLVKHPLMPLLLWWVKHLSFGALRSQILLITEHGRQNIRSLHVHSPGSSECPGFSYGRLMKELKSGYRLLMYGYDTQL